MSGATSITVRVPLAIRRRPGRKTVVTPPGGSAGPVLTRADPALLKALARAFRWQRLLDEGRYASISELAAAENIERGYLGKVLQLTLLAPSLVEAIVGGRHGAMLSLPGLMEAVPTVWGEQLKAMPDDGRDLSAGLAATPLALEAQQSVVGWHVWLPRP